MSEPKVFSPGVLTLALAQDAFTSTIGVVDLKYIKSISVTFDSETKTTKATVEFFRSHDPEVTKLIEEQVRIARTLRWVEVRY